MTQQVLTQEGRVIADELSNKMYHGDDSEYTLKSDEPEEIEKELIEYVESCGFDYVVPDEIALGTARKPFLIPDHLLTDNGQYIVKFARYKKGGEKGPQKGRIQNECEIKVWRALSSEQRQYFVPIRDFDSHYFWLVMDYAECFERDETGAVQTDSSGDPKFCYDSEDICELVDKMEEAGVTVTDYISAFGYHENTLKCLDYGIDASWYNGPLDTEEIVDSWGEYNSEKPAGLTD